MKTYRSNRYFLTEISTPPEQTLSEQVVNLEGVPAKVSLHSFGINIMPTWIDSTGEKMEYADSYEEKKEYLARTKCPCDGYLSGCEECKQEKGNNPMREKYDDIPGLNPCPKTTIAAASSQVIGSNLTITGPEMVAEDMRKYLAGRALMTIEYKISQLRDKFKIDFEWRPKTVQEANERLRAGLFTIRNADKKDPIKYPWGGLQDALETLRKIEAYEV